VRLWDSATGSEICPIPEHRQGISFLSLSADGRTVITEGRSSPGVPGAGASLEESPGLRYWHAPTGMRLLPMPGHDHRFPPEESPEFLGAGLEAGIFVRLTVTVGWRSRVLRERENVCT